MTNYDTVDVLMSLYDKNKNLYNFLDKDFSPDELKEFLKIFKYDDIDKISKYIDLISKANDILDNNENIIDVYCFVHGIQDTDLTEQEILSRYSLREIVNIVGSSFSYLYKRLYEDRISMMACYYV